MTNGEWFDSLSNKQLEKWRNQEHISNKKRKKDRTLVWWD